MSTQVAVTAAREPAKYRWLWIPGLLAALAAWSYWPTIAELHAFCSENDDYSVGQLVPFVAGYLVYRRRRELAACTVRPSAWGLLLLAISQVLRFGGIYFAYASVERLSLVVLCGGLILFLAGWPVFRRLLWVQAFLLLTVPLPTRVHNLIALPLQDWATTLGGFGLELLGFYVVREGNVLRLDGQSTVMVSEACSGLRMLMAFVFTSAFLCFLVRRPAWQKIVLMVSSVPVALVSNGLRILVTSVCLYYWNRGPAGGRLHDAAGLAMMPLAIALLVGELKFLTLFTSSAGGPRLRPAKR
jgi:exosortase